VRKRFFAHVQTGPGAHPGSCTMGTWYFPGVKRPGRGADQPPPPKHRGREWVELYLYFPCGPFVACYRVTFTFTYNPGNPSRVLASVSVIFWAKVLPFILNAELVYCVYNMKPVIVSCYLIVTCYICYLLRSFSKLLCWVNMLLVFNCTARRFHAIGAVHSNVHSEVSVRIHKTCRWK
jgi:hypothetical protein